MEELTRIRNERGWSQQRLSEQSGVNKATINQVERGKRSPNVETLAKLARALGVGVADFFPKAQASLWSGETAERRLDGINFGEAAESLEEYCERWERTLAEGKVDDRALQEFFATAAGWIPMMDIALKTERDTRGLINGDTEIGRACRRYHSRVFSVVLEMLKRREFDTGDNVVNLQEVRETAAMLRDRAVG